MHSNQITARFFALAMLVSGLAGCGGSPDAAPASAPVAISIFPDDPPDNHAVITALPTDLVNIKDNGGTGFDGGISPIGRFGPSSNHVKPVDHQYVGFPNCPGGAGTCSYPVYAMGNGYLSVIFRSADPHNVPAIPADYALTIGVSKSISLNYDHVNALAPVVQNYINANNAKWMCMMDGEVDTPDVAPRCPKGPWAMFFGQLGNPAPLFVSAGATIATTTNYHGDGSSWDVGVTDARVIENAGHLVNTSVKHFPDFAQMWAFYAGKSLGALDFSYYPFITRSYYSHCVFNYMNAGIYAQLTNNNKVLMTNPCGHMNWDVAGSIQGVWFNAAVDAQTPDPSNTGNMDTGAISIVRDATDPANQAMMGWGNAGGAADAFALLDPWTWSIGLSATPDQLLQPFIVPVAGAGAKNPDPALATTVGLTYCYDLPFANGTKLNYVLVNLVDAHTISVNYGYTSWAASGNSALSGCDSLGAPPYALPGGAAWKTYSR